MKKSPWNENEIEDMLRELPKLKDNRTKEEVMAGIYAKKKKKRSLQLIAGIASLFLMIVFASAIWMGREYEVSQGEQESNRKLSVPESEQSSDYEGRGAKTKENSSEDAQENQALSSKHAQMQSKDEALDIEPFAHGQEKAFAHAIYEDELKHSSAITLGVPDDQMNIIVPISIKLRAFDESDTLNQLVRQMAAIDEKRYGLADYFPLDVSFNEGNDKNTAHIEFQEDSPLLDDGLFLLSMEETLLYHNIEKLIFTTDGKQGARFSHGGFLTKLDIPQYKHRTYLLYQKNESSPRLLVPSTAQYQDFAEALQAGKRQSEINGISPAIPTDLNWERIKSIGNHVTIHLAEDSAFENSEQVLQALEAILFIAKDFGYETVKFENAPIEKVGNLDLTGDIAVPRAPNQMK
ncbi:hypothetical protein [Peribacillus muralis]|uniref:hypothetical protein n=1 Tax=Peribacillus muralis TaxID=264697 RepID=UPI00070A64B7|nr:hypothetical protein [Peribacillus muralis]